MNSLTRALTSGALGLGATAAHAADGIQITGWMYSGNGATGAL